MPGNYRGLKLDTSDGVFMTSRGGTRYDRTFMEAFVRPGMDLRNWVSRANTAVLGVVPTGPGEMSLYVARHKGQPSHYIERLALRLDGFASVRASYAGGEMLTRPSRFRGGNSCSTARPQPPAAFASRSRTWPVGRWRAVPSPNRSRSSATRSSARWRGRAEATSAPCPAGRSGCASC